MYIIGCRAHFCHLPGLDLVGHSPEGTSGSAGTLDWDPMWSGSQSTCHPYAPCHPCHPPMPLMPYTPSGPKCPWHPNPCWPWAPTPLPAPMPLTPLPASQFPLTPPTSLLASWVPIPPTGPWHPLMPLHPASSNVPIPTKPLMPPDAPYTPCWPLTPLPPEEKSSCEEWYYYRWAWHVISLWGRLLFCHMYPHPLNVPRERHLVAKSGINWGPVDLSSCYFICSRLSCGQEWY